jgi:hypothetical protein
MTWRRRGLLESTATKSGATVSASNPFRVGGCAPWLAAGDLIAGYIERVYVSSKWN